MKRLLLLLGLMVSWSTQLLADDRLTVEEFSINPGEMKSVTISLENEAEYTGLEFVLELPAGISIMEEDGEYYILGVEDRLKQKVGFKTYEHTVASNKLEDGVYKVMVYSGNNLNIVGHSGPILELGILAAADATPGQKKIMLKTVKLAKDGYNGTFPADAEFNVTINDAPIELTVPAQGYKACYYDSPCKLADDDLDSQVELYGISSVTNTQIVLTEALSGVPAETPFLLYNPNNSDAAIKLVSCSGASAISYDSDHFKGTLTALEFTTEDMKSVNHYMLTGKNFVWVKDAGTLSANGCWIELPVSSTARSLTIVKGGDVNGIITASGKQGSALNGNWYTIQGRKLAKKPAVKGVYINKGKKEIIR